MPDTRIFWKAQKILVGTIGTWLLMVSSSVTLKAGSHQQLGLAPVSSVATQHNTVTSFAYTMGNKHRVFAGGDGGFIEVFDMNGDGKLMPVQKVELYNKKGPTRGLIAAEIAGNHYLFAGNKGGNAIEVYHIASDGSLKRVFVEKDSEQTFIGTVITLRVVKMKSASYLFAGGLEETPGLSCFRIENDGRLSHVQSIKDDQQIHTDGIIGMYDHTIGGKTFLFTGGFQDNGISSFRVFENGHFKNINNIDDNNTDRYLTGAYPVTGVALNGNYYVVVGHRHHKYYKRVDFIKKKDFVYHGDGVSVFKVNGQGELIPHHVLVDNGETKLAGQTRIEIVKLNEQEAIVAVGTRDDNSIQLCRLGAEGILQPAGLLDTGYPIYYGMASQIINGQPFFLAGSVDNNLRTYYAYKVELQPKVATQTKLLRHVVSLKYKSDATTKQIDEAVKAFEDLEKKIPEIIDFEWGVNNSKEGKSKGFTHSFMLSFRNEETLDIYLKHPDHLALVAKVGPLLDDVFVMDYWTN